MWFKKSSNLFDKRATAIFIHWWLNYSKSTCDTMNIFLTSVSSEKISKPITISVSSQNNSFEKFYYERWELWEICKTKLEAASTEDEILLRISDTDEILMKD